jgi:hypothetical protein
MPLETYDLELLCSLNVFKLEKKHLREFQKFDCSNILLTEYLYHLAITEQDQEAGIQTFLAVYKDFIMGFVTICDDILSTSEAAIETTKRKIKTRPISYRYKALKIGRLAVNKLFERKGIGTFLVAWTLAQSQQLKTFILKEGMPCDYKFITADSYTGAKSFYCKLNFHSTEVIDEDTRYPDETTELLYLPTGDLRSRASELLKSMRKHRRTKVR